MGKTHMEVCDRCGIDYLAANRGKHKRFCDGKWPTGKKLYGINFRRKRNGLPPIPPEPPGKKNEGIPPVDARAMSKIASHLLDMREEIAVNYCPCCGADIMKIRKLLSRNGKS